MDELFLTKDQIELLYRRGYDIDFKPNGAVKSFREPKTPLNALQMAIRRKLVEPELSDSREAYLEWQNAYASQYAAKCDGLYTVRGNDGDGSGADKWIKLIIEVGRPKYFALCDWGFHHPPKQGEHLADYAEAFEAIHCGLRNVREAVKPRQQNACNRHVSMK